MAAAITREIASRTPAVSRENKNSTTTRALIFQGVMKMIKLSQTVSGCPPLVHDMHTTVLHVILPSRPLADTVVGKTIRTHLVFGRCTDNVLLLELAEAALLAGGGGQGPTRLRNGEDLHDHTEIFATVCLYLYIISHLSVSVCVCVSGTKNRAIVR